MIAVEMKGMDPKYTWEIFGIYRAPHEDMRVRLRDWQPELDFRKTQAVTLADWNENAEVISGIQAFINRLVWGQEMVDA